MSVRARHFSHGRRARSTAPIVVPERRDSLHVGRERSSRGPRDVDGGGVRQKRAVFVRPI
jgi:hypothetical protein